MESIGEARDSQSSLGWVDAAQRATALAEPELGWLRAQRIFDVTITFIVLKSQTGVSDTRLGEHSLLPRSAQQSIALRGGCGRR